MIAEPTPWRAMISLARQLGISPAAFWRLSLAEWRALIASPNAGELTRADLDALVERFPDS